MAGMQNVTLRIEPQMLDRLRDYAYTERITLTEAVNNAVREYLADKRNLLERPHRYKAGLKEEA